MTADGAERGFADEAGVLCVVAERERDGGRRLVFAQSLGQRGYWRRIVCFEPIAALQSEVAVRSLYDGTTLLPEAVSRYQAMGFEVAGMYPRSLEADHLRVIEFDCLMVQGLSGQPPSA